MAAVSVKMSFPIFWWALPTFSYGNPPGKDVDYKQSKKRLWVDGYKTWQHFECVSAGLQLQQYHFEIYKEHFELHVSSYRRKGAANKNEY